MICLCQAFQVYAGEYSIDQEIVSPVRAKVMRIITDTEEELGRDTGVFMTFQTLEVEIRQGIYKGQILQIENVVDKHSAYNFLIRSGDQVLVLIEQDESGAVVGGHVYEFVRDQYLWYVGVLFIVLLLLIGGRKGFKSLITLIFTGIAIVKIMIPMILAGASPVWISIISAIIITIFTFLLVSGWNRKTLCAVIGTSGGVIAAGIISFIMADLANLTGLGMEEAQMLKFIPQQTNFDFKGILLAGIILGALGAAMDVSMSIASAIEEIRKARPDMGKKELFKAGMNVGRDIMGTMSNTLILAYVGTSIPLMLLFLAYDVPLIDILNRDMVASEVVRSLAGSIGLFLTVPLTALASGVVGEKIIQSE